MIAIREILEVKNNKIHLTLPDEFKNKKVEIIILPIEEEIDYWNDKELKNIGKIGFLSKNFIKDNEDYSKW